MSNPKLFKYEWIWDRVVNGHPLNAKKQPLRRHEVVCVFYKKQCTYNPQMVKISEEKAKKKLSKKGKKRHASKELTGNFTTHTRDFYTLEDLSYNYPTDILKFNSKGAECSSSKRQHPTQKPVELFEYLIKTYTNEGETVLDNCLGSGTTAIAAINTERNYIGIEKEEEYYLKSLERIKNHKKES